MKPVPFNRILGIFLLSIFSFSCSSDLDFNQVNTVKLEPIFVTNLASFDVPANQFVTNGIEQIISVDSPTIDVFNDAFFRDNLNRADFFFEINNTINRAYVLDIVLIDKNNQPLYAMNFFIPAYTGGTNVVTKTEIFQNAKLNLLKSTTKMSFVLRMLPGPILTENSSGSIKLRSSVTAYLVIQ